VTQGGVLVIGDVVTDVLALHRRPPAPRTDTAADIEVRPGGSAGNTAAWAASLGAEVTLLARVGTDTGDWHRAQLTKAGVHPRLVVDPEHATAVIIVMVDGAGERTMLTDRGAGGRLGPADWDDGLLDGVTHLHVSGYTLFTDCGRELARSAMARARSKAITVSVDPASTGFLEDFGVGRFIEATGDATLIFPNREEAALLTGGSEPDKAAIELSAAYDLAVVKLGADGALAARDGTITVRAPAVAAHMIDSTGAGDAFAGGFIAARMAGGDDADAVQAGTRAGARAITQVGGRPR
jgi:sugar/nucleoside kinase (ribokinase family)